VRPPEPDLPISVVEAAHSPRLQHPGDPPDVIPLDAGERQRHIPPQPWLSTRVHAVVRSCHDVESPTSDRRRTALLILSAEYAHLILDGTLIPIDWVAADQPFYSGRHHKQG
jgi:hypothetical protein